MVHMNRLVNQKQLIIVFGNGVRQNKESHETETCVDDVRRLCDSDIRTRDPLIKSQLLYQLS